MTTFDHTADWQLGKPIAKVDDLRKRSLLQQERLEAITRIGIVASDHQDAFIVVAGDLFDSPTATKSTLSAACAKVGALEIPVLVISGNHDHGGPGSLWDQPFFEHDRSSLAPNLGVLLAREPVERSDTEIFPCSLPRGRESRDPAHWLRSLSDTSPGGEKPRFVITHGSTQGFGEAEDDGVRA
jgi:hypothetical protein